MQSSATSVASYLHELTDDKLMAVTALRNVVKKNLPKGFKEVMSYGMIAYVVPHSIYPAGYHCNPDQPLPFICIAAQKNFTALYHMGLYADEEIFNWFVAAYKSVSKKKPDMGKSCLRFKRKDDIPLELIGELCSKMSVRQWIGLYESKWKR